ncbi:alpha/beta hydrolase [Pseudomonas viridiflava]|nr:alpha/beta hydrolase [Pseudomonas viridiflava]MCF9017083.1 alpha/beta hydrolase fold domain-containing protein [Pseudomonas syringae]MEE3914763.1 alpha/beta hydrolase [Pseudomonas viridiflava]MEE3976135.1 alpha/beta hydrolase [Pseudomonas viridiflava]MEE4018535.1 alpha/beta hydrolase [Pseudomonas viridiflava]MEE4048842.1 alpha/beta hydrolase [Pseudomonas viridiflava]
MNTHHLLDPAYNVFLEEPSSVWTLANLPAIRRRVDAAWKQPEEARHEEYWTQKDQIRLCIYRPEHSPKPAQKRATLLYIHGGGFVLGRPEMADDYLADLANELNVLIVAVDYRLAPEHPFPIPLEDCYAALAWIFTEGLALGVDKQKVMVMGHSAGGGLAAAVSIMARDRNEHRLAGLLMVYPMLDHRTGSTTSSADNPTTGTLSWSREANRFCWECLQGAYALDDDQAALFSPALADDLTGLPPSFMSVGALDLFLEEDVAFALRLSKSGVPVELHVYPGVPHMFDQYPGRPTDQLKQDITRALACLCADEDTL